MKKINLNELSPNPSNPRKISEDQKARLKKALLEFGDLSGIIFNRKTQHLSGGHQRVDQLKNEENAEVTITKEYDEPTKTGTVSEGFVMVGGERFAYREVEWDEAREKAANIAANKHGGEFDIPKLNEWLLELDAMNYDMDLVGFSKEELENLMAPITKLEAVGDPEHIPQEPKHPKTVKGDIYQLGDHRLICGDSTMLDDIEALMAGKKADMVFTDPPYNVAYVGKTKDALTIENDSMDDEKFYQFLFDVYTNLLMATKPGGAIYVAHADSEGANFRNAMKKSGWLLKQCLIWVKQTLVMGRQDYHWKHEPILYGWAPGAAHNWFTDRKQTTVLEFDRPSRSEDHPTMKPVALVEYMIMNSSKAGQIVLDTFGGSGTTMIAAAKNGRIGYLCELEPKYCDVIVQRFVDYTGKKEVVLNGETIKWKDLK